MGLVSKAGKPRFAALRFAYDPAKDSEISNARCHPRPMVVAEIRAGGDVFFAAGTDWPELVETRPIPMLSSPSRAAVIKDRDLIWSEAWKIFPAGRMPVKEEAERRGAFSRNSHRTLIKSKPAVPGDSAESTDSFQCKIHRISV